MILSFTGSQYGPLEPQLSTMVLLLSRLMEQGYDEFHHGLCVGADGAFHEAVRRLAGRSVTIHGHPGDNPAKQRLDLYDDCDVLHPIKPNLTRNADMLRVCDALMSVPRSFERLPYSGTWSTIHRAAGKGIPDYRVWPDGNFVRLA